MTAPNTSALPSPEYLDPVNRALLPIIRHFLISLQTSGAINWRIAFETSAQTWGEGRGSVIAFNLQNFLCEIIKNRSLPLKHCDPQDLKQRLRLEYDECEILGILTAMRTDNTKKARDGILRLMDNTVPSRVVETGLKLANHLDPDNATSAQIKRPIKLRAIS